MSTQEQNTANLAAGVGDLWREVRAINSKLTGICERLAKLEADLGNEIDQRADQDAALGYRISKAQR